MTVLAVFPLALVRDVVRNKGAKLEFATPNLSFVHCGDSPLVAWVGWSVVKRFGKIGRFCYIDANGKHVFTA